MTDSLVGARLKLNRAREHLEVLRDELAAFAASEPYRVAHEPNADGSEHIFRAQVLKEPPPFLSVIIGDALHNMRSTLEHLVWGLALIDKGSEPSRSTSFPIYRTSADFWAWSNRLGTYAPQSGASKIAEITRTRVRTAIEQLQPYKTGNDHLLLLNELARIDRHQSLRLMGAHSDSFAESWRKRGERNFSTDLSHVREARAVFGPFQDGAEVGYYLFHEPEMEVNLQLTPYVAFRDEGATKGRHALGTLANIRRHIQRVVVPKLERFF